jgi:predicted amidophosphoribosyltransferase
MAFPRKICVVCNEEFELRPDKPGFATHCPDCTAEEERKKQKEAAAGKQKKDADDRRIDREADAERRKAIRDLLYRKDS